MITTTMNRELQAALQDVELRRASKRVAEQIVAGTVDPDWEGFKSIDEHLTAVGYQRGEQITDRETVFSGIKYNGVSPNVTLFFCPAGVPYKEGRTQQPTYIARIEGGDYRVYSDDSSIIEFLATELTSC